MNKPGELATVICSDCQTNPNAMRVRIARHSFISDRFMNCLEFIAKIWSPFWVTLFLASFPSVVILEMTDSRLRKACIVGAEEVLSQFDQGKSTSQEFEAWKGERLKTVVDQCEFKLKREFGDLYVEKVSLIIILLVGINVFRGNWWKKEN